MTARALYRIERRSPEFIVIRDVAGDAAVPSVTNDAESIVVDLEAAGVLRPGMRLFYFDSDREFSEIVIGADGKVKGFRAANKMFPVSK